MESLLLSLIEQVVRDPSLIQDYRFILASYDKLEPRMKRLIPLDRLIIFLSSLSCNDIESLRVANSSERVKRVYQLYYHSL